LGEKLKHVWLHTFFDHREPFLTSVETTRSHGIKNPKRKGLKTKWKVTASSFLKSTARTNDKEKILTSRCKIGACSEFNEPG
jgi:hypothetical protein